MAGKDMVFRFIGVDAGAGREFDKMAGKSTFAHNAIGKMALGAVAAGATVAVASVKMAADFQSSMELIRTQAGQSQGEVDKMSTAVLALAGPTATAPEALAAGLYHLESAGLHGAKALAVLKTAALGAKVGHADLEEVTNALNATIASGIPGAQNMSQAMGMLNATVGAGDMRMADLAEAFGTGFLATVKGFGVTLNDAGAALATFGDNNIRGADAATQLRMAVLFMAKPAAGASAALGKIGLNSQSLAKDLQSGGLNKAVTDLHDHLEKAGYTGNKAGQILLDAFGHKAGTGLSVLVGQYSRFESKMEEVKRGASGFGDSVKGTTKTFAFQMASAKAAGEALLITIGMQLLPAFTSFAHFLGSSVVPALASFGGWVKNNQSWLTPLAVTIGSLVVAFQLYAKTVLLVTTVTKAWAVVQAIMDAELTANPIGIVVVALAALAVGLIYAYKHSETFRNIVNGAMHAVAIAVDFVRDHWKLFALVVANILGGPFLAAIVLMVTHFGTVKRVAGDVAGFFTGPFLRAIGTLVSMSIGGFKLLGDVVLGTFASIIHGISTVAQHVPFLPHSLKESLKAADHAISDFKNGFDNNMQGLANAAAGWGEQIGGNLGNGMMFGLDSRARAVATHAQAVAKGAIGAINAEIQARSPSRKTMYLGQMMAEGIIVGFGGARQRMFDALTSTMKASLEHLHAYVLRVTDTMMARVSAARGVLAQAYSNRSQYASGLVGQLTSGANLTNAIDSNTGQVGNLSSFLASQVAQMKAFAGALSGLSRRHLASGLLQQIAEAGPTQGLALARSITPGQIGALNAEQAQLNRYASAAANTTARSVYAAEIARDAKAMQAQLAEQRKANHLLELIARRVSGEKTAKQVAAELANLKRTTGRSLGLA